MIQFLPGDKVEVILGSSKTHDLRTLIGTVTGAFEEPVEGTKRAYQMFTVMTSEGVVTSAGSRMAVVGSDVFEFSSNGVVMFSGLSLFDLHVRAQDEMAANKKIKRVEITLNGEPFGYTTRRAPKTIKLINHTL